MTAPELSIVIPVHNNGETLANQLAAVTATADDRYEVIVVDNRSTDDTRRVAHDWAQRTSGLVRVVVADERASEGYARNVGAAAARSDRLAFCDGDDIVGDSWPAAMDQGLREHSFVTGPVDVDR